ncbi:glycosyltransferase family 4 protein [Ruminococcus albus]|uniref:Glycosyltransferase, group 1 family protein n=1 Tax=Ruminococcus albus 8 TaxID=246199 RepID=E9S8A7_RUMAL|nr:glycosyltransferase family 4 protein [Ruminococcus albus]EGC04503.1 glycosyltransferase, group 1 family protein [Ruminococcus albus 8]MCC3352269.1 glycosyltransferase family 4 protein [Ruminococcus albus 8]
MKKVLILANNDVGLYQFRQELISELLKKNKVYISLPYGEMVEPLKKMGCKFINNPFLERHGTNPFHDLNLLDYYKNTLKKLNPDVVLTYTIKCNVYGGMACSVLNIPYVVNVTGLGTAIENSGVMQKIALLLYRIGLRKAQKVFFQNTENRDFMLKHHVVKGMYDMLPGSGVNLERFPVRDYPSDENGVVRFAFISRIMKEKGIDYYLFAAKAIKRKYPNAEFHICGFCEAEYEGKLNEYNDNGTVIYHGMIHDVAEFLNDIHCVVHPTYYPEGLSNVLLEACASGRPIITTDRSGCREVVDDGVNGYMIPCRNGKKLIEAVDKFMRLQNEERKQMGLAGRTKVQREFDRQIVVQKYVDEVEKA